MKNYTPETISDLIDRQMDGMETELPMDGVTGNPELLRRWRNYHLIGDVIRGDVQATGNCLIGKIEQRIAAEPRLAISDDSAADYAPSNVVSLRRAGAESKADNAGTWKSAGMFAVAASVALMAVLTLKPTADQFESATTAATDLTAVTPVASPLAPNALEAAEELASFESEFGQMMVEHGEFTATSGLNGLLTYAKVVSNEGLDR